MSTTTAQPPKFTTPEPDEIPGYTAPQIQPEFIAAPKTGFYDSQGKSFQLGAKIGAGGQGNVFEVVGNPHLVAKIYHSLPSPEKAQKLIALAKLANERLARISAWPMDVLRELPNGRVIGFLMHKIVQADEVHALHSPKSRLRKFPEASWAFLIHAATNIARAVAALHEQGFVIGDVNPKNILVTRKATVYLLDCDSFQFTVDGVTHRCDAGFPDYTPPELQGIAFKDIDRNQEHDSFGLAIVIFQLLFLGRHPYSGRFLGQGEMPLERAIRELRFAYGEDAAERHMQPPPGTLSFAAIPAELASLFRRAFLQKDRPNPSEWIAPLESLAQSLERCSVHNGHLFFCENSQCPWCALEVQSKTRLFNFQLSPQGAPQNPVLLDSLWQDIKTFKNSTKLDALILPELPLPKTSDEALALAMIRKKSLFLGLGIGVVGGIVTGYYFSFQAFILLFWVCRYAIALGKAEAIKPQTSPKKSLQPEEKLIASLTKRKENLEKQLNDLRQRYGNLFQDKEWQNSVYALDETYAKYAEFMQSRANRERQIPALLRAQKLKIYLQSKKIDDPKEANFDAELITWLKTRGFDSAADMTSANLQPLTFIPASRRQSLLNWRNNLENKYWSEAKNIVSKQEIYASEHQLDAEQQQFEKELFSRLHNLKKRSALDQVERNNVQDVLIKTHKKLVQISHDYEIVSKRNSPGLIIGTVIATFLASAITTHYLFPTVDEAPLQSTYTDKPANKNSTASSSSKYVDPSMQFYEQGVARSREEKYIDAIGLFEKAIELDKRFYGAYNELAYAYYKTGRYELALETTKALGSFTDFDTYGNKALIYAAQHKWELARDNANTAISRRNRQYWYPHFPEVCYARSLALVKLGEAPAQIVELQKRIAATSLQGDRIQRATIDITEDNFELATLYLAQGKFRVAMEMQSNIYITHRDLGVGLEKLIRQAERK